MCIRDRFNTTQIAVTLLIYFIVHVHYLWYSNGISIYVYQVFLQQKSPTRTLKTSTYGKWGGWQWSVKYSFKLKNLKVNTHTNSINNHNLIIINNNSTRLEYINMLTSIYCNLVCNNIYINSTSNIPPSRFTLNIYIMPRSHGIFFYSTRPLRFQ